MFSEVERDEPGLQGEGPSHTNYKSDHTSAQTHVCRLADLGKELIYGQKENLYSICPCNQMDSVTSVCVHAHKYAYVYMQVYTCVHVYVYMYVYMIYRYAMHPSN